MPESGVVRIYGREYRSLTLRVRRRFVKVRGKRYPHYSMTIPRWVGEWLWELERQAMERFVQSLPEPMRSELQDGEGPDSLPVVVLIGRADWYHLLLWETFPPTTWAKLGSRMRGELEALALDPVGEETVLIPVKKSELEKLGLDPSKPITLEDIKRVLQTRGE